MLSVITFKDLQKCIGGDIETVIKKNEHGHERKMKQAEKKEDYSHLKLEDLLYI